MKHIKRTITIHESTFAAIDMETNQVIKTQTIETTDKPTIRSINKMAAELNMIHVKTVSKDIEMELPLDLLYLTWKQYTSEQE